MKPTKKLHSLLQLLGTLTCTLSLLTLYTSVFTTDWLTIQEPQLDANQLEKMGPYESSPPPHLLKAKLGLLKICTQLKHTTDCTSFDFHKFIKLFQIFELDKSKFGNSDLVLNCVNKMRLTLPFIAMSVVFTTGAFLSLTFGHFCERNKKIVEASLLILAGLTSATALLTFVAQIGSEFESTTTTTTHKNYRYKYGYSFYLFLLSFSLSELAALFDMAAYFKKNKKTYEESTTPTELELTSHPDICCESLNEFVPQSYLSEVVVTNPYCTVGRVVKKTQENKALESFATMRLNRL